MMAFNFPRLYIPRFASACLWPLQRFADRTILLNAPSKTYNVPGLGCSYAIIPDKALRVGFAKAAR